MHKMMCHLHTMECFLFYRQEMKKSKKKWAVFKRILNQSTACPNSLMTSKSLWCTFPFYGIKMAKVFSCFKFTFQNTLSVLNSYAS